MDKSLTLNSAHGSRSGSSELKTISEGLELSPPVGPPVRLGSIDLSSSPIDFRSGTLQNRVPMPSHLDLEKRFTLVLVRLTA